MASLSLTLAGNTSGLVTRIQANKAKQDWFNITKNRGLDVYPVLFRVQTANTSASGTDTASRSLPYGTTHIIFAQFSTTGTIGQSSIRFNNLDTVRYTLPPLAAGDAYFTELIPVGQYLENPLTQQVTNFNWNSGTLATAASTIMLYSFVPRGFLS